ncbi:MAG: GNAT family N-acetyltransferase, partial [Candidatus Micrarchaeota archaeon]
LSPEKKLERSLLAQTLRMWRKDFPAEERQEFSAWPGSFSQNRRGQDAADYHFIAAYKGTQKKPEMVGYATLHASIPRKDLPTPVALAEYSAIRKDYRRKGIYDLLFQKRRELARSSGSKYIIAEVEPFNNAARRRWQSLRSMANMTPKQKEELRELASRRKRLSIFSKYYMHADMPYLDPSEHVTFPAKGRGILNRKGKLNPLWLLVHDLGSSAKSTISREEGLDLLRSVYRGPQDLRRSDADWMLSQVAQKVPSVVKLRPPNK